MLLACGKSELGDPRVGRALLTRLRERAVKIHFAVDQTVVGGRASTAHSHHLLDDAEVFVVIPIAQYDRADVAIIRHVLGSVDDHGPEQPTSILTGIMRVIPTTAVQIRFERISQRLSRRDRALLNRRHPIIPGRRPLEDTMPVQGSPLFRTGNLVRHFHLNRVSPIGFDEGGRELTVDQDDALVDPIRGDEATLDGEIVASDDPGGWRVFIRVTVVRRSRSPREALRQRVVREEVIDQGSVKGSVSGKPISSEL